MRGSRFFREKIMETKGKTAVTVAVTAVVTFAVTAFVCVRFAFPFVLAAYGANDKLSLVKSVLDNNYLYDYDKNEADEYSAMAYVASLDEPYTAYYPADVFRSYNDAINEEYTGIGVIVTVNDNNEIEVISAYEDGPAYKAGILTGDIIKAVDGEEYDGSMLDYAVEHIRGGETGTAVELKIIRNGSEEINMTVERGAISQQSVKSELIEDGVGYIRISNFNISSDDSKTDTADEFIQAVEGLKAVGAERVVLDLRGNPGGVLDEACEIADYLLPEGIITYTEDKNGNRTDYTSDAENEPIPMTVLINGGSASASEVLTGALKDYGRAEVIGETSYGKGIVQNVYGFADGSGISVTSAKYYTPNGVCIHEKGIEPDITVELPDEYENEYVPNIDRSEDAQLIKAVERVKER